MTNPTLELYWITPFALMLLAIAVLPLFAEHWWSRNSNKLLMSLALALPVIFYFLYLFPQGPELLSHTALEYISFIILLASLYVVSGGIHLAGDIQATPLVNCCFLLVGSLLASLMGTTGATMFLIRPLLATNRERTYVAHTVFFFIVLVGNIGGMLTPLGDPPLFMGYLNGVPFGWTLQLWPQWLLGMVFVLAIYAVVDLWYYRKEPSSALIADRSQIEPLRLYGKENFAYLLGILLAVAFFRDALLRNSALITLAVAAFLHGKSEIRAKNEFNFAPIIEVTVLFFGIFATMIPALYILQTRGPEFSLNQARQFFWVTGALSSFLDNTPTYVVFFNLARSLNLGNEIVGMPQTFLKAISIGAVFFGAVTYVGNAPNFMVKAIAEHQKVSMPSFFVYMLLSTLLLLPLFFMVSAIWF